MLRRFPSDGRVANLVGRNSRATATKSVVVRSRLTTLCDENSLETR